MKIIYCDGSSLGNPGKAGFGVVAIDTSTKKVWEFGEHLGTRTNNQAELEGCLFSMNLIKKSFERDNRNSTFEMRLDSKYVIMGVTEWSKGWMKNGWKNSQKKEVENKELWQKILKVKHGLDDLGVKIFWTHIYGHTGEEWNERVDEIAKNFAFNNTQQLRSGEHSPNLKI